MSAYFVLLQQFWLADRNVGKENQGITNEAHDSEFVTTDFEINKKIL